MHEEALTPCLPFAVRWGAQGGHECFVFSDVGGVAEVHKATGCNRYFVLAMNHSLAFGGGGHFALQIDGDL